MYPQPQMQNVVCTFNSQGMRRPRCNTLCAFSARFQASTATAEQYCMHGLKHNSMHTQPRMHHVCTLNTRALHAQPQAHHVACTFKA